MVQILINLVAGALGGVGSGKASPNFDLGTVGNLVAGLVGGGVLGQIVTLLLPSVMPRLSPAILASAELSPRRLPVVLAGRFSRRSSLQSRTRRRPDDQPSG
jgi:hypothetical protein